MKEVRKAVHIRRGKGMCVGGGGVEEAQKGLNGNLVKPCVTLLFYFPSSFPLPVCLRRITVCVSAVPMSARISATILSHTV